MASGHQGIANKCPVAHVVYPIEPHTHTIILLHEGGVRAEEFASELFSIRPGGSTLQELFPSMKWVFPHAEVATSMRYGKDAPLWFDPWSVMDPNTSPQSEKEGLKASLTGLMWLILQESREVATRKLFLGGLGMGCATAVYAMLMNDVTFCGFIGVAGWLPLFMDVDRLAVRSVGGEQLSDEIGDIIMADDGVQRCEEPRAYHCPEPTTIETPVLLCHSKNDAIVPVEIGERLQTTLMGLGMRVRWKVNNANGHWIDQQGGLDDIVEFLQMCME